MLIVFRSWYFVGIFGVGCAVYGGTELNLALEAAKEPERVSLHDLEQGVLPSQPFVSIGKHYAAYGVASYELKRDRIKDVMYPLVSDQHPWSLAWDELHKKYESAGHVPAGELPSLDPIRVLGLTKRFESLVQIPDEGRLEEPLIGILHSYNDLSSDEQDLVQLIEKKQPGKVVVIEIGRRPKSVMFGAIVSGIGCLLGLLAIWLFFRNRAAEAEEHNRELVDPDFDAKFAAEFDDTGRPGMHKKPPALPGS